MTEEKCNVESLRLALRELADGLSGLSMGEPATVRSVTAFGAVVFAAWMLQERTDVGAFEWLEGE